MRTTKEIIEIIKNMKTGESLFFREGCFYVDCFSYGYRFYSHGGDNHYSAKPENLKVHIRKAIKRYEGKNE